MTDYHTVGENNDGFILNDGNKVKCPCEQNY